MSDHPWADIAAPSGADSIRAKRVDPDNPWGFFWGRALDRKCLFVLSHGPDSSPVARLPNLKGVEITDITRGGELDRMLVFKLINEAHRDIFERLCRDIVACASGASSEREAVALTLARTWRWHHLLRGGSDERLSAEEQKGLAGELLLLERQLLGCLSARESVDAWRGPTGSPKDFEIGQVCVEVKARRGAATPHIAISSADQLDTAGIGQLFLYAVDLDQAPAGTLHSFTLTELSARVRDCLVAADASVEMPFEQRLAAAGFDWAHDYSDMIWVEGASRFFDVAEGFPRISASALPPAISHVRYSISLHDCVPFLVEEGRLAAAINARRDVGRA